MQIAQQKYYCCTKCRTKIKKIFFQLLVRTSVPGTIRMLESGVLKAGGAWNGVWLISTFSGWLIALMKWLGVPCALYFKGIITAESQPTFWVTWSKLDLIVRPFLMLSPNACLRQVIWLPRGKVSIRQTDREECHRRMDWRGRDCLCLMPWVPRPWNRCFRQEPWLQIFKIKRKDALKSGFKASQIEWDVSQNDRKWVERMQILSAYWIEGINVSQSRDQWAVGSLSAGWNFNFNFKTSVVSELKSNQMWAEWISCLR